MWHLLMYLWEVQDAAGFVCTSSSRGQQLSAIVSVSLALLGSCLHIVSKMATGASIYVSHFTNSAIRTQNKIFPSDSQNSVEANSQWPIIGCTVVIHELLAKPYLIHPWNVGRRALCRATPPLI